MTTTNNNDYNNSGRIQKKKDAMDKQDRKIIALLEIDPKLSQSDIAKEIGLAQSSIAVRMYKLKESSILVESSGVNYEVLGMLMCRVDVATSNEEEVLKWAEKCPLFMNASKGIGRFALSLFFTAEDVETFHYLIDEHILKIDGVSDASFQMIRSWQRPFILQLNLDYSNSEKPPCGMFPYCPKCPSNPRYNGRIWNHQRLQDLVQK